jgi:hypothetical protein
MQVREKQGFMHTGQGFPDKKTASPEDQAETAMRLIQFECIVLILPYL